MALAEIHEDALDAGVTLVTLCPQLPEFVDAWIREDTIPFPVLTDLGNGVAREYGLVFELPEALRRVYRDPLGIDLPRYNGDTSWTLPMPAGFVIDADGTIVRTDVDADYTRRPEPAEMLELAAGKTPLRELTG